MKSLARLSKGYRFMVFTVYMTNLSNSDLSKKLRKPRIRKDSQSLSKVSNKGKMISKTKWIKSSKTLLSKMKSWSITWRNYSIKLMISKESLSCSQWPLKSCKSITRRCDKQWSSSWALTDQLNLMITGAYRLHKALARSRLNKIEMKSFICQPSLF